MPPSVDPPPAPRPEPRPEQEQRGGDAEPLVLALPDLPTPAEPTSVMRTEVDLDNAVARARRAVERIQHEITARQTEATEAEYTDNTAGIEAAAGDTEIGD